MENSRKRRIDRLVDILEKNLEVKRKKLSDLEIELNSLENTGFSFSNSQHASTVFLEDLKVETDDSPYTPSELVVSLPLSPSRKSSRLLAANPPMTSTSLVSGRREAGVLGRISDLQKEGKWSMGKKLAKLQPPVKPKTHWDFVLEEMAWLSGVFSQEMKLKKAASKKCARMVAKHFSDKTIAKQKAEKAHEQNLRRMAAFMAKEVRGFWGNVEKLFQFRLKSEIEKKRKQAVDEHLNFIVDRTEKFSTMLAESMAESASIKTTPTGSDSELAGAQDDGDYEPDQNSDDDEATIGKDEDNHEEDEIDLLQAESEMPVEELLKRYYPGNGGDGSVENASSTSMSASTSRTRRRSSMREREKEKKIEETEEETETKDDDSEDEENDEQNGPTLKALVTSNEERFSDVIEMAAKFQPTGNTLDTTSVKTKVPFILKGTLREYQHIGLDWMVSLQERKLNGILADEMGLGKTIQTISLLAHLACEKHIWGPHLIVVPTSVMLNWEMELKKWAPAFKVMTYYGSQKERRLKRVGWTKPNAFHVCVTSYKLVIQDHQAFRRKRWQYLILDEAQHIKNFKSQRWQLLLNFSSEGRLLLTGTPLQNNLMELWSLMHFLMPNVFESHRDFKEWFSNPLTGMVEGSAEYNDGLIQRLHKVLRPFLLRRLKNEVEKQLPKKYEHIVKCPLSKRQRYLYDDFMSRTKTQETLDSGNLLSVINILMQLRKVCNHPNLFEPRPTLAPFVADPVQINIPIFAARALQYDPLTKIDLNPHPLIISNHEFYLTAYAVYRLRCWKMPNEMFEKSVVKGQWNQKVECPKGKLTLSVKCGPAHPTHKVEPKIPLSTVINNSLYLKRHQEITLRTQKGIFVLTPRPDLCAMSPEKSRSREGLNSDQSPRSNEAIDPQEDEEKILKEKTDNKKKTENSEIKKKTESLKKNDKRLHTGIFASSVFTRQLDGGAQKKLPKISRVVPRTKIRPLPQMKTKFELVKRAKSEVLANTNKLRCSVCPTYGLDVVKYLSFLDHEKITNKLEDIKRYDSTDPHKTIYSMSGLVTRMEDLAVRINGFNSRFNLFVNPCVVVQPDVYDPHFVEEVKPKIEPYEWDPVSLFARQIDSQQLLQLPETRLIQYDCGKLQVLGRLLQKLKEEGHRVLLFTQMTKVLDVLESFMNFQGHTYLRLDGSTKIEQRQILMERFNSNNKYFCFILSTRSGGVGVNLTGADTVIFYDSDWNPTMDAQAQDRCHRIGQTRDVHIYRLVSERSIEENILKKANQKRLLGDIAIEGGNFTTAHFKKSTIRDLFEVEENAMPENHDEEEIIEEVTEITGDDGGKKKINLFESALAAVEENTDVEALKLANQEAEAEEAEFNEEGEKEDDKFGHLLKQLTPIERFALSQVEFYESDWKREQLAMADAEIEAQRREFDARKLEDITIDGLGEGSMTEQSTAYEDDDDDDDSSEDEDEDVLASPRTRSRFKV